MVEGATRTDFEEEAMEGLQQWMKENRFSDYFSAFVDKLGVECVDDLQLVMAADMPIVGLKPVQARRFTSLLSARGSVPVATAPSSSPQPAEPPTTNTAVASQSTDSTWLCADERRNSREAAIGGDGRSDSPSDCEVDSDGDYDGNPGARVTPPTKRRKINRLSKKQRVGALRSDMEGTARVRLHESYGNGRQKGTSEAASHRGTGHAARADGNDCPCSSVFLTLAPQFLVAKRTARELQRTTSTDGDRVQKAQSQYNYARLGRVAIDVLFDGRGNWLVHEACARRHLNVSNSWLARCHSRAIEAAHVPIVKMTKSAIASSPNVDALVARIRRPDDCLLSAQQFFKSSALNTVFDVTASVEHGLCGAPSNRTKVAERNLFVEFVRAHRSPTGRTADKNGRFHGAAFYLDSKWAVLRNIKSDDTRVSFYSSFDAALAVSGRQPVHTDIPLRWLRSLFGSTTRIGGRLAPSDQHTTLYPHKTDACSTCEFFHADLRAAKQSLKRHNQQSDQASMQRQDAIREVKTAIEHMEEALMGHKNEASVAMDFHKQTVAGAAERYEVLVNMFDRVMCVTPREGDQADGVMDVTNDFISRASKDWFEVSSDYQQDKSVPAWNLSPQPGPTYFMSGVTHYVHIFCVESCGETTGPSRFSRNVVYSRSERVGGAKSSDDTLSTLSDMLLGGECIGVGDPPVYRSGFGPDGALGPFEK